MIRDREAFEQLRVAEERRALRAMDMDASIAITERLLSSSLISPSTAERRPRPLSLARALGIPPERLPRRSLRE